MKQIRSIILIIGSAAVLHACGGAETKVEPGPDTSTVQTNDQPTERPVEERVPAEPRSGAVDSQVTGEKHEILRNIDKHLVSEQTASDRLSVQNKLTDVDFQRVIVEVSEITNGQVTRTNFYQLTNLDAGSTKVVKITPPAAGVQVDIHIVKAKSAELTGGAMILVGSRYSPET
jgi:PBP1b-binding outer membrane lipoprotein LpoB